jgi:GNAT superfamily N-acetyltransferase
MQVIHAVSSLIRLAEAAMDHWVGRQARRRIDRLPPVTVTATANYYKPWTAPSPDYRVRIGNAEGVQVGTGCYAVSPLHDRVYVFKIEIAPEHRRRGYGTAFLWHLAQRYRQPITAVDERYSSREFWSAARRLGNAGLPMTTDLSSGDMDAEANRWQHLRGDAERLQRLISERLNTHHEPWHIAVGRGLESGGD